MPSELYKTIGEGDNVPANQDPKSAAMSRMKELGIEVPKGKENDPDFLINYVMQTGKVPQAQNRLTMALQRMQRMFRR